MSLTQDILSCANCSLCQERIKVVIGEMNPSSKILFIGEAPGKNEDEQGMPFVGRCGKERYEPMLASIGLSRGDVSTLNVVKCRPSQIINGKRKDRKPTKEEMSICSQWLKKQIVLLNPKIIATMGVTPMELFTKEKIIGRNIGRVIEFRTFSLVIMYHPAASLYDPNKHDANILIMQKTIKPLLSQLQ